MKNYRVMHRITKQAFKVKATSAQEACEQCGWLIGNCHVHESKDSFVSTNKNLLHNLLAKERNAIITVTVQAASEGNAPIERMAQTLANKITGLGIVSALELLAAIGWKLMEPLPTHPKSKKAPETIKCEWTDTAMHRLSSYI